MSGVSRRVVDRLDDMLRVDCPELERKPGEGEAAYRFHAWIDSKKVLLLGRYDDGRIYTDVGDLTSGNRAVLAGLLREVGITVPTRVKTPESWAWWESKGQPVKGKLDPPQCAEIARRIRKFLDSAAVDQSTAAD